MKETGTEEGNMVKILRLNVKINKHDLIVSENVL